MSDIKTIKEAYASYAKGLPDNASDIQRRETRRAYYFGATALFVLMMQNIQRPTVEWPEADLKFLDALNAEIGAFMDGFDREMQELHRRVQ